MINLKTNIFSLIAAVILSAGLTQSAFTATVPPTPLLDDNGNMSFAKQLVPKLLGRKPKGMLEVKLLADIANLHGREALVRTLMEQPEFVSTWSTYIIDQLKTKRASVGAQNASCFNEPMLSPNLNDLVVSNPTGVAEFVRDNDITANYSSEFNFQDVVRSSISLDSLLPAYRSYLYIYGSKTYRATMISRAERREVTGIEFDKVFLNRDMNCMTCHNTTYSTTGIGDRTHPLYHSLDIALFTNDSGPTSSVIDSDIYQNNCAGCHGDTAEGASEVGVKGASAELINSKIQSVPAMAGFASLTNSEIEEIAAALDNSAFSESQIPDTQAKHYAMFRADYFAEDPEDGWAPWGMSRECASILGVESEGPIPGFFAGLSSDYITIGDADAKLMSGYQNLPYTNLQSDDDNAGIAGDVAFAHMVATKITENVWQQFFGSPLRISNKYARNASQKHLLKHLTEDVFLANDWSLKELIVAMTQSAFFNRRAPINSEAAHPYELQAVLDPFANKEPCRVDYSQRSEEDAPTREVIGSYQSNDGSSIGGASFELAPIYDPYGCAYNGVGDIVHRYAPSVLLQSISSALDWSAPKIFPSSSYPSEDFQIAIGQYHSPINPGDDNVSFQSLLNWDGTYGQCDVGSNDWIDKLIASIDDYNTSNPGAELTLQDIVLTVKDWLIQEPVFGGYHADDAGSPTEKAVLSNGAIATEFQLVKNLFNVASLNINVTSASIPEGTLRQLCGVYLKSPQFMLAGITRNDSMTIPNFRVCNNEPCNYQSMCLSLDNTLESLGHKNNCNSNSVTKPIDSIYKRSTEKTSLPNPTHQTAIMSKR